MNDCVRSRVNETNLGEEKMERRQAVKLIGSLMSAPLVAGAAGAAEKPLWKTAIGLNGFHSASGKYQKTFPIWEVLDYASETGFDGVELVEGWPQGGYPQWDESSRIRALRRMYDGFGLQIFSIQNGASGAFAPDRESRKEWLDDFRGRARLAKTLGCECIGLWPGGGLRGQTIGEAIDRLAESLREVGNIAADLGLLASFEIEPPFVFNTEEHLMQILEKTAHPSLKTMLDPSHYDIMNGSAGKPSEMLERIGVENIGYVHLTDTDGTLRDGGTSKHLPCGDGHADIARCLSVLREGGFRGWIMIDPWEIPDPYDACTKGKRAIDRAMV